MRSQVGLRKCHSLQTKLVEAMEFQLSYFKSWKMMLWKCCTQYASKFGKLSSGHRTGKGQFSFQSQRRAMPKNVQTTAHLHSSHTQYYIPETNIVFYVNNTSIRKKEKRAPGRVSNSSRTLSSSSYLPLALICSPLSHALPSPWSIWVDP